MKLSIRGVKRKQPVDVSRAIRDFNLVEGFGWTVEQIDRTPVDRLNRILTVKKARDDELERKRKERERKNKNRTKKAKRRR